MPGWSNTSGAIDIPPGKRELVWSMVCELTLTLQHAQSPAASHPQVVRVRAHMRGTALVSVAKLEQQPE